MHVLIVTYNAEIDGVKDKRHKYIKVNRVLDKLLDKYSSLKSWVVLAPGVFMSEGRVSINTMKRIKAFVHEKLGDDVLVLASKEVTEVAKDIELARKVERDYEMEWYGYKYVSDVKVFGGVYYITLPKSIAKNLKVRKGSKVVVWVRKP